MAVSRLTPGWKAGRKKLCGVPAYFGALLSAPRNLTLTSVLPLSRSSFDTAKGDRTMSLHSVTVSACKSECFCAEKCFSVEGGVRLIEGRERVAVPPHFAAQRLHADKRATCVGWSEAQAALAYRTAKEGTWAEQESKVPVSQAASKSACCSWPSQKRTALPVLFTRV